MCSLRARAQAISRGARARSRPRCSTRLQSSRAVRDRHGCSACASSSITRRCSCFTSARHSRGKSTRPRADLPSTTGSPRYATSTLLAYSYFKPCTSLLYVDCFCRSCSITGSRPRPHLHQTRLLARMLLQIGRRHGDAIRSQMMCLCTCLQLAVHLVRPALA